MLSLSFRSLSLSDPPSLFLSLSLESPTTGTTTKPRHQPSHSPAPAGPPSTGHIIDQQANRGGASDAKSYVLVSQLPPQVYKKYVEDEKTSHLTGFTFVVISILHLAGGKITEENLWHHLKRLGLSETDENHPVLGNTKQSLEALVQQRYLQKDKTHGPEGTTLVYELAERSLDGPIHDKIKEYVSQIVNKDVTPTDAE